MTGKKPGVVLILRSFKDEKYLKRLERLNEGKGLGIRIWVIRDY